MKKLLSEFSGNRYKPRAIHDTAWEYRKLGNYGRADELDKYVIDHWPADVQVMWAKMDMAKTDILLGNDAAVEKTIDLLIADFNECPELPTAIFMLGEQYYNKAFAKENQGRDAEAKEHFRKAITIWDRIIKELPESRITSEAYFVSAECYRRLGEHETAIEYYNIVLEDWPDCQYAWCAQFDIGRAYEYLKRSGVIPKSEADSLIKAAYEQVLEVRPNSPAVGAARNWLKYHGDPNQEQEPLSHPPPPRLVSEGEDK